VPTLQPVNPSSKLMAQSVASLYALFDQDQMICVPDRLPLL
jgi:hypothetical protein